MFNARNKNDFLFKKTFIFKRSLIYEYIHIYWTTSFKNCIIKIKIRKNTTWNLFISVKYTVRANVIFNLEVCPFPRRLRARRPSRDSCAPSGFPGNKTFSIWIVTCFLYNETHLLSMSYYPVLLNIHVCTWRMTFQYTVVFYVQ